MGLSSIQRAEQQQLLTEKLKSVPLYTAQSSHKTLDSVNEQHFKPVDLMLRQHFNYLELLDAFTTPVNDWVFGISLLNTSQQPSDRVKSHLKRMAQASSLFNRFVTAIQVDVCNNTLFIAFSSQCQNERYQLPSPCEVADVLDQLANAFINTAFYLQVNHKNGKSTYCEFFEPSAQSANEAEFGYIDELLNNNDQGFVISYKFKTCTSINANSPAALRDSVGFLIDQTKLTKPELAHFYDDVSPQQLSQLVGDYQRNHRAILTRKFVNQKTVNARRAKAKSQRKAAKNARKKQ
ncbi:hypothetical protein CWB96_00180 [Pseudoalteromonas citrea]|uniref:Uncharacterized protein n=1 Tax=Pseudoalteromonas citrea TaxID=43655 RepID=A0A5S3XV79_9GAMM|nr:hypothetical protein [Pseudoalteromonas citrea]TMP46283.1 hypothetical protein CWB97_02175 [Pseudoalteromonas citrea]TMP63059.1 hypothetical protein CWB96_00180 [Pseudoalteromonas citrea]